MAVMVGSTQRLAELAAADPKTIPEVLDRIGRISDHAARTSLLGENDGIASFSRLYYTITENIAKTVAASGFADPAFLIRLDIEFAQRYFAAIRAYAADMGSAPRCWRLLFDRRGDPHIPALQFAAAGVNAHVNFDLAMALIATWRAVPPDDEGRQHGDYQRINDIFAQEMDGLRERFGSPLSAGRDGAIWDRIANHASDLIVRLTRNLAWDEATRVWSARDRDGVLATSERRLDVAAEIIGLGLLNAALLPV